MPVKYVSINVQQSYKKIIKLSLIIDELLARDRRGYFLACSVLPRYFARKYSTIFL